ncbi:MAG: hypothetical protein JWL64_255 [Frankiales bacterium]|nr:hypothetical protein [Frankiales bacterium]
MCEVRTGELAQQRGFVGSPTVHIDGIDALPNDAQPALTCRTYDVAGKLVGAPSQEQLRDAFATHAELALLTVAGLLGVAWGTAASPDDGQSA